MESLTSLPVEVAAKVLCCLNVQELLDIKPIQLPRNFKAAIETKFVWRSKVISIKCTKDYSIFLKQVRHAKNCQRLSLAHSRIGRSELMKVVLHAEAIEYLNLDSCADIDDESMTVILDSHGKYLKYLNLNNCQYLTNYTMMQIARRCVRLHTLIISNCSFSPAALEALTESESIVAHLKVLNISKCYLMDNMAIFPLARLVNLLKLSLCSLEWMNDAVVVSIIEKYTSLREIDIRNCENFTKSSIKGIKLQLADHVSILENAKLVDESPESIRRYLMSLIHSTVTD